MNRKPLSASCYIALHAYVRTGAQSRLQAAAPILGKMWLWGQAYAALYEWHANYKLSASAFDKVGASKVLQTLRSFARKEGVEDNVVFGTEVVSVREQPDRRCVRRHPCNQVCRGLSP